MFNKFLLAIAKSLFSVSILLSFPVAFAEEGLMNSAQAQAAVESKCASGCLVLSPEEITVLEENVNRFAKQAFEAGVQNGASQVLEAVKSNPKQFCPKNI